MSENLWMLPVAGALLGWLTNWIAVRMLFHPRKPIRLFGWTVMQGLIPSRRAQLANQAAEAIEAQLVHSTDFESALHDPKMQRAIKETVETYVAGLVERKLASVNAVTTLLMVSQERLDILKRSIVTSVTRSLPGMTTQVATQLKSSLDLKSLVADRIIKFSDDELESMVMMVVESELRSIEHWGLLIGAVVGSLQWLLMVMI